MDVKSVKDRQSFENYWDWVHENHKAEWDLERDEPKLSKKVLDYPKFPDHMIEMGYMFSKEGWNDVHKTINEMGVHKHSGDIELASGFIEYLNIFLQDNKIGGYTEQIEKKIGKWYVFYNDDGDFYFRTKLDMSDWQFLLHRYSEYLIGD